MKIQIELFEYCRLVGWKVNFLHTRSGHTHFCKKKDAELNAAKNTDLIKEHEEAIRVCYPFI
jgi:hypothetical protein